MIRLNYNPNIIFSTFASLSKNKDAIADYYVFDEVHLLGEENQVPIAGLIAKNNKHVIFASGTISNKTMNELKTHSLMDLIIDYSSEKAIEDNIVADFKINIHKYELDDKIKLWFGSKKKWQYNELKECNRLSRKVQITEGKEKMFASLSRMHFINNTNSLVVNVKDWISENSNKRFILFAASEKIGKLYEIPMFNSKSKDDKILKDFQNETINQLCLIKKASSGVTFKNLDCILITAINSNGENLEQMLGRSLLNDIEGKQSQIHIFVSNQEFQLKWLNNALENISTNKIC